MKKTATKVKIMPLPGLQQPKCVGCFHRATGRDANRTGEVHTKLEKLSILVFQYMCKEKRTQIRTKIEVWAVGYKKIYDNMSINRISFI